MSQRFTIIDAPQRSPEWFAARAGKLTGSRAKDMLASIKSGEAAARLNLRLQLVLERITGKPQDGDYVSPAMQVGIDREADAYAAYEAVTGQMCARVGFLVHPELQAGVSPDGYLGNFEGTISIKCPQPAAHLEYLSTGMVPNGYLAQIVHEQWITGAQWCDFFSFQPDFPPELRHKLVRVDRDEQAIAGYDAKARAFLAEVDAEVERVQALMRPEVRA